MKRESLILLLAVVVSACFVCRPGQAEEPEKPSAEAAYHTVHSIASSDAFKKIVAIQIPTGYAISLPIPTLRAGGRPAFAWFASPRTLIPGTTPVTSAPDRWWLLDAQSGGLLIYSLVSVHPFTSAAPAKPGVNPPAMREGGRAIGEDALASIDRVAPVFFTNGAPDETARDNLRKDISALFGEAGVSVYRQLAPDFFNWLDRSNK